MCSLLPDDTDTRQTPPTAAPQHHITPTAAARDMEMHASLLQGVRKRAMRECAKEQESNYPRDADCSGKITIYSIARTHKSIGRQRPKSHSQIYYAGTASCKTVEERRVEPPANVNLEHVLTTTVSVPTTS